MGTCCPASPCITLHHPASLAAGQKADVTVGYTQTLSPAWSFPCNGEQRVSYRLPSTHCFLCQVGSRDCTWFSLTSVALSSTLIVPFFINSLLIFTPTDLSFPFFPSLHLFSHPLFSIFYLLHFSPPKFITSLSLPAERADFLPIAPSLLFPESSQAWFKACWSQLQVCDYKNNKIPHFGTKGLVWKPVSSPTCFRGHPGLEGLFFSKHSAQNRHLLQRK